MSSRVRGDSVAATTATLSVGRKSLRSAAVLDKQEFKGDKLNPSYAIDAEIEGISNAVDRSDDDLKAIDLGRKYSGSFGNVEMVIIDLAGTMVEDLSSPLKPFQGALEAYNLLKDHEIKMIFMTNSWKTSKKSIVDLLNSGGFDVKTENIFTSSDVCIDYLKEKDLKRPYYLVDSDVIKDFSQTHPRRHNEDCVIVGLPSTQFDYRLLSKGMNLLFDGVPLITINMMKRTVTPDIQHTSIGPGPFVNMLSVCTDVDPVTVCKPSRMYYEALAAKFDCSDYSKAVVIGDDIYEDIAGAREVGFKTILTRTGRYQLNDEKLFCSGGGPDATAENFTMAVRLIMASVAVSQMSEEDFIDEENSSKGCGSIETSLPKEEQLTKKMERYVKSDAKFTPRPNPIRLPSYIW